MRPCDWAKGDTPGIGSLTSGVEGGDLVRDQCDPSERRGGACPLASA